MKTIEFTRRSMPTDPATGYGDTVKVYDGTDVVYEGTGSACPNPYRPSDSVSWEKAYAMVSLGIYSGQVTKHDKFGKCILLENGEELPTINENSNQGGRRVASEVFIHVGGQGSSDPRWRGSKACLTIPPMERDAFFKLFDIDEKVVIVITTPERKV